MAISNGDLYHSNKCGDVLVVKYTTYRNILIKFVNTGYQKIVRGDHLTSGNVRDPYAPTVEGVGYLGEGSYTPAKDKKAYKVWGSMLTRCYGKSSKESTYRDCTICEEWLNFQNFCLWFYDNYIEGYQLDKDIKIPNNTTYSPLACMFVSHKDNTAAGRVTGKVYKLTHVEHGTVSFTNQKRFSEDYGLSRSEVSAVLHGKSISTKGWVLL